MTMTTFNPNPNGYKDKMIVVRTYRTPIALGLMVAVLAIILLGVVRTNHGQARLLSKQSALLDKQNKSIAAQNEALRVLNRQIELDQSEIILLRRRGLTNQSTIELLNRDIDYLRSLVSGIGGDPGPDTRKQTNNPKGSSTPSPIPTTKHTKKPKNPNNPKATASPTLFCIPSVTFCARAPGVDLQVVTG